MAALMQGMQRNGGVPQARLPDGKPAHGTRDPAEAGGLARGVGLELRRRSVPWAWGWALASGALACAPPLPSSDPLGPISDERKIFLQEAGELPPPTGPCPEALNPDVLSNPRAAVTRTAFGLAYCFLEEGPEAGRAPQPTDTVRVHYTGWTPDGQVFDSSVERGEPAEFPVNSVIRGWAEALVRMTPGDRARLWIPGRIGYGRLKPGQEPGLPPKGTLIFEVELIETR